MSLAAAVAPVQALPWWRVGTEFLYFVGLVPVIGGALVYRIVIRPSLCEFDRSGDRGGDRSVLRGRAATLLGATGPILLVTAYLQLAGRVARADPRTSFGAALAPLRMWRLLRVPAKPAEWVSSGTLLSAQNALFVLVVLLLVTLLTPVGRQRLDGTAGLAGWLAAAATVANSLPTNLGTASTDDTLTQALTQVHILGTCSWLGGLTGLTLLAAFSRSALSGRATFFWAQAWQRFSVVALTSVGAIITSGSWLAWKHVGGPGELLSTTYGRFLLVKLLLVATMVTAGGYNQFRLTPRIAQVHAAGELRVGFALTMRHFPAVVSVEAALGAGVLMIVPFLHGSARAQHGDPPAPLFDGGILALGGLLVLCLAASLFAAHRVSRLLVRRAALA